MGLLRHGWLALVRNFCILERGKEFQPGDFDGNHQLIKHGEYPDTEAEALREVQVDLPKLHTGPRPGLHDMRVNDDTHFPRDEYFRTRREPEGAGGLWMFLYG